MPRGDDDDDNKCGKDDWEKVAKFLYRRFPTYESWNNLDGKGAMRQLAKDMRAKADYENTKAISMCAVGMLVATVQVERIQEDFSLQWNDEYLFSRVAEAFSGSWDIMRNGGYPVALPHMMDIFDPLIEADEEKAMALCDIPKPDAPMIEADVHQSGLWAESKKRKKK